MNNQRIYVAGHRGMVGSAIVRALLKSGYSERSLLLRTRAELDLTNQNAVNEFFELQRPDQVYLAAAKVGGISANNSYPADFIYENLMIEGNVINSAFKSGVKKLLFLGSSCIYPKHAPQPMTEEQLLNGFLEATNEPYAVAKIAGIKLCESYNRQYGKSHGVDYRSVMPTNLYGPGDNYHPENSHVVPALIRRFHEAKLRGDASVHIWGTGNPLREFLFVDDMAEASLCVMNIPNEKFAKVTQPMLSHINVGFGTDVSIAEAAKIIARVVGYNGKLDFDTTKPDGTPKKLMDSSRMRMFGWKPRVSFEEGLFRSYNDFLNSQNSRV